MQQHSRISDRTDDRGREGVEIAQTIGVGRESRSHRRSGSGGSRDRTDDRGREGVEIAQTIGVGRESRSHRRSGSGGSRDRTDDRGREGVEIAQTIGVGRESRSMRLQKLCYCTRRLKGGQIEVSKILNGYENIHRNMFYSLKKDRGYEVTLMKDLSGLDIRKYSFHTRQYMNETDYL